MLDSIKEVLTKDIEVKGIKEVLTKDIELNDVKDFFEMEIELNKLKELLATEIKMKEFLLQEIDMHNLFSSRKEKFKKFEKITASSKLMLPVYDLGLIETLRKDHKEILFIYEELMENVKARKYPLVVVHLERFTVKITDYFAMADAELYSYLKIYIHLKFPKREKAFTELSLEMKNISLSIFYSISQSPNIPLSDATYRGFIEEFKLVGEQLYDRIDREKKVLFGMYEGSHIIRQD